MAEVEISYQGGKIAELSASGTKTLLTQGKYCQGNIQVSYTRPTPAGPSGSITITENGTYDVSDKASAVVAVPSVKRWVYTNPARISETQVVTLVTDSWLAAHYNDAALEVTAQGVGQRDVADGNTYWIRTTGRNTPWNANGNSSIRQIIGRFSKTANTTTGIDGKMEGTSPNSRGMLRINENGALMVRIDANCMMEAGNYEIIARLLP